MNLIQQLRIFKDLADKVREYDIAGKLDYAGDLAEQAAEAMRQAADLIRQYLGTPTVGAEPGQAAALVETEIALESALSATRSTAGVEAISPALLPVILQALLTLVQMIRDKRK